MSIYHKVNDELLEFASKVEFDDQSNVLTINGVPHTIKSSQIYPIFTTVFDNFCEIHSTNSLSGVYIMSDLIPYWTYTLIPSAGLTIWIAFKRKDGQNLPSSGSNKPTFQVIDETDGTIYNPTEHHTGTINDWLHYYLVVPSYQNPSAIKIIVNGASSNNQKMSVTMVIYGQKLII